MITKEQYTLLKDNYFSVMHSVMYAGFGRTTSKDWNDLAPIYAAITGKELSKAQLQCGECKKKALKIISQEYWRMDAEMNKPQDKMAKARAARAAKKQQKEEEMNGNTD